MGNILVADDDKTCRDSIQKVLEREGHTVEAAESVDGALDALRLRHFDLVVCDYRMPGKTGIDLLVELKRREATVPVLMISAYADVLAESAIMQLGALEFMKKPIRRRELVARAARVMEGCHVGTCSDFQGSPGNISGR
jgi:two-component system, NtrC family, nitrogen regulation response regulator NtrX